MSIMKLLMGLVVLGAIVGVILAATGVLTMDKDGNVSFSQEKLDQATTTTDYTQGNLLFGQAKYTEAIGKYQSYIAQNPSSPNVPEARFRIAKCYEDSKQEGMAIKYYKEYLKLCPNDTGERPKRAKDRIDYLQTAGHKEAK